MDITPFKDQIKAHLDKVAKKDKLFAKNYKKENKSLDECVKYIFQEVQRQAKGKNAVGVADDEIYNLAIHYYDEDSIKVGATTPSVNVIHSSAKTNKATINKVKTKKTEKYVEFVPLSLEIPLFE